MAAAVLQLAHQHGHQPSDSWSDRQGHIGNCVLSPQQLWCCTGLETSTTAVLQPQVRALSCLLSLFPACSAPIRPDIVRTVHTNMNKNHRQAYAVSMKAGHQTAAESWGTGRAVSRIPRVPGANSNCWVQWLGLSHTPQQPSVSGATSRCQRQQQPKLVLEQQQLQVVPVLMSMRKQ
jgi:hypothetical protein